MSFVLPSSSSSIYLPPLPLLRGLTTKKGSKCEGRLTGEVRLDPKAHQSTHTAIHPGQKWYQGVLIRVLKNTSSSNKNTNDFHSKTHSFCLKTQTNKLCGAAFWTMSVRCQPATFQVLTEAKLNFVFFWHNIIQFCKCPNESQQHEWAGFPVVQCTAKWAPPYEDVSASLRTIKTV